VFRSGFPAHLTQMRKQEAGIVRFSVDSFGIEHRHNLAVSILPQSSPINQLTRLRNRNVD
jgi:hypothetical protein